MIKERAERALKLELLKREIERFIDHITSIENASGKGNNRSKDPWSLNSLRAVSLFSEFNMANYDDEDFGNALTALVREKKLKIIICKSKISFYPL